TPSSTASNASNRSPVGRCRIPATDCCSPSDCWRYTVAPRPTPPRKVPDTETRDGGNAGHGGDGTAADTVATRAHGSASGPVAHRRLVRAGESPRIRHATRRCAWQAGTMRIPTAPRLLVVSAGTAGPLLSSVPEPSRRSWPDVHGLAEDITPTEASGARAGRTLGRLLDQVRPDLVLSTHPVVTAGLAWLRRHRGFGLPTASWDPATGTSGLDRAMRLLATTPPRPEPRRLPASDALFAHIDSPAAPQHVGTVLVFEPGPVPTVDRAAAMLASVPGALGRIVPATATQPARWLPVPGRA